MYQIARMPKVKVLILQGGGGGGGGTRDSELELQALINLWPSVRTFYLPLPLSIFHFRGIQSHSYTDQRKVKTDVD